MLFPLTSTGKQLMRLDYFVAHATGLSRAEVKRLIRAGAVSVPGLPQISAATRLGEGQMVKLNGEPLALPEPRYLMLHKPVGVVCSTDDPRHPTVLSLLPADQRAGLHIAGRLDLDTTGLVLLTDDGAWSHRVTAPGSGCRKTYLVSLAEPVSPAALTQLREGVMLRGEKQPTRPATVEQLTERQIRLSISEGRYHQVKRMLAAVGNHVCALHREAIGEIRLGDLDEGEQRPLSEQEVRLFSG